ncbi:MAG TPA: HEAT repeat domain-containing protein [Candidatus Rifleibacterium sp.]|nr:HEAT repeat domain-containing protein [Candidatus Rifleibacterium sp.]HPT44406.1 HEAT repeat domain-containing protein [Candidatus Rifleibacterium sp.]
MDYATIKKLFQDRDKSVRLFCLKSLLQQNIENADEFILEGLRDGRPEVVIAAMKAAKKTANPEIGGMIVTYLESPNSILRNEALHGLLGRSHPEIRSAVCDFLKHEEDPALVATGVKVIGSFKSSDYIPLLKAFLNYADERVRANAVESLGDINHPEVIEILKVLVADRNNRVRANAIKALWVKGIRFGLNTLPEELRSPNTRKRASVAYILGEIQEDRSLELLVGLLSDISPTVRNRAVLSLGKIGSSRVIPQLVDAFFNEDEVNIRETIILTLIKINPETAMTHLSERFNREENPRLRSILVKCLGKAANQATLTLLTKALRDTDGRVRANAVESIGQLKDQQLAELLFPLLNDSNNRVRSNAATSLWKLGGTGAIVTLKQMIRSSHKQMRSSAAWALGEIGALQFSDVLQDLTGDADPDVRRCALKALAKLSKIT